MNRYLISPKKQGFNFEYAQIGIIDNKPIIIDEDTFQSKLIQDYIKTKFISYEIRTIKPVSKKSSAKGSNKKGNTAIDIKQDEVENSGIAESNETSDNDTGAVTPKSRKRNKK